MANDVPQVTVLVLVVVFVVRVKPVSVVMVTAVYALVIRTVDEDIFPWITVAGGGAMIVRVGFGDLTTKVTTTGSDGPELYGKVLVATRETT
jgi:hypothetical protein